MATHTKLLISHDLGCTRRVNVKAEAAGQYTGNRLKVDVAFGLWGNDDLPGESTFSRVYAEFAQRRLPERVNLRSLGSTSENRSWVILP